MGTELTNIRQRLDEIDSELARIKRKDEELWDEKTDLLDRIDELKKKMVVILLDPFCPHCGGSLLELGVIEHFRVFAQTKIDLGGDPENVYGDTDIHYDTSELSAYECAACGSPVADDQRKVISEFVGRNARG